MRKALKMREPGRNDMMAVWDRRRGESWAGSWGVDGGGAVLLSRCRKSDFGSCWAALRLALARRVCASFRNVSWSWLRTSPIDTHQLPGTRLTMASKYAFSTGLKELRFLFCQTSEHSAATRYDASTTKDEDCHAPAQMEGKDNRRISG